MRVIDADALKGMVGKDDCLSINFPGFAHIAIAGLGKLIDKQPTIDAVPVVRCKDCKYYPDGNGTTKWLPCREMITRANWFCADGEREDT